jgi:hypothetical protein
MHKAIKLTDRITLIQVSARVWHVKVDDTVVFITSRGERGARRHAVVWQVRTGG